MMTMALAVTMLMGAQTMQAQDVLTPEQQAEMKAQADAAKATQKEADKALKEQKAAEKAQKKKEAEARKKQKEVEKHEKLVQKAKDTRKAADKAAEVDTKAAELAAMPAKDIAAREAKAKEILDIDKAATEAARANVADYTVTTTLTAYQYDYAFATLLRKLLPFSYEAAMLSAAIALSLGSIALAYFVTRPGK